jgi:hypothetical protein
MALVRPKPLPKPYAYRLESRDVAGRRRLTKTRRVGLPGPRFLIRTGMEAAQDFRDRDARGDELPGLNRARAARVDEDDARVSYER